jgi:gamma-carbonic anhydrase
MSMLLSYLDKSPQVGRHVFLAHGCKLIGDVRLGEDASVFYNSVLRADINYINIGNRSNVQDNCTFHVSSVLGIDVGNDVTIGHNVVLHACKIGDAVTVGMGAIVMDGAEIGKESIVAAGALVTKGKQFPARSIIAGSPAKVVRELTEDEVDGLYKMAEKYIMVKNNHLFIGHL